MEKVEYRAYIKTRTLLGISATEISKELESAHGTQAPKYSTVAKWTALFREGRIDLNDDLRSGRQITVHTAANIEFVRQIIGKIKLGFRVREKYGTFDLLQTLT